MLVRFVCWQATEGVTAMAAYVSPGMRAIASSRLSPCPDNVQLRQLDADAMPAIDDGNVDAYSMSLVMKICDRRRALDEAFRVLRPGGRLVLLAASNIPWAPVHMAYTAYMAL